MANTDSTHAEGSLVRAIWRLELARARHLLRAYLRTRLHKLERHVTAVLDDPAMQARLSPLELQYAKVGRPLFTTQLLTALWREVIAPERLEGGLFLSM